MLRRANSIFISGDMMADTKDMEADIAHLAAIKEKRANAPAELESARIEARARLNAVKKRGLIGSEDCQRAIVELEADLKAD